MFMNRNKMTTMQDYKDFIKSKGLDMQKEFEDFLQNSSRTYEVESDEDSDEEYFEALSVIASQHGISRSQWNVDYLEGPIRDFSQPHGFTATMVDAACGCNPTEPVQLIGDTWLDVWKSIERFIAQKKCGHVLIENIHQIGDTLDVFCGS
jgi:hypothetical protein